MKARLEVEPLPDRDLPARHEEDQGRERHDPQASELKEGQEDCLSCRAEIDRCIFDDETGDADGGGRGEKCVDR